jgi:hypothetical protein
MFKRASLTLLALLAVPAAALPKTNAPKSTAKTSGFTMCARPFLDSYSHAPLSVVDLFEDDPNGDDGWAFPYIYLPW